MLGLMDLREIARLLAAARKKVEGRCVVCDRPFTGLTRKRFCSRRCYWRYQWALRKDRVNEQRRESRKRARRLREGDSVSAEEV